MRWIRIIFVLAALMSWVAIANAGDDLKIGSAGAQELRIPVGSRGTAMGGSAVAYTDGIDAIFWNPAGVSNVEGIDLMLSRRKYIADIDIDYIAAARQMGDAGVLAFTAKILSAGEEMVYTVQQPDGTGATFSSSFSVIGVTYARQFTDRVSLGINGNMIYEKIADQTATGFALDIGFKYDPQWHNLTFAAVVKNLGPKMGFDGPGFDKTTPTGNDPNSLEHTTRTQSESFEMPSYFQLGMAYAMIAQDNSSLDLAGTFQSNNFAEDEWRIGAEYGFDDTYYLRGGYTASSQKDYIFGASLGAGLAFKIGDTEVNFDYAWGQTEFFDASQYFTFQLGF